jgi:hypothetical protein
MRKVDLGPFTEEDMIHLFKDLMNNLSDNTAIGLVHAWIEENGLEEEFGAASS